MKGGRPLLRDGLPARMENYDAKKGNPSYEVGHVPTACSRCVLRPRLRIAHGKTQGKSCVMHKSRSGVVMSRPVAGEKARFDVEKATVSG
jgi:hypothetical protein